MKAKADTPLPTYKPKDFTTDQDVRWCPGCGDYAILTAVRKALTGFQSRREDYVFVSGIGCAARFPYYMETYGLHSIHGRAPAFATGIKLANPDLDVWLVSGDGDLLSIGGNHTFHVMRRNVDINILLLNNRIYGLTKGQYSPTSEFGKKTKSTPVGSPDYPVKPLSLALGAGCTFVARCIDIDVKHLEQVLVRAADHRGTSLIEVYQDCNIYNHKAWFYASQKESRADNTVMLEHGKPIIFGADRKKALRMRGARFSSTTRPIAAWRSCSAISRTRSSPSLWACSTTRSRTRRTRTSWRGRSATPSRPAARVISIRCCTRVKPGSSRMIENRDSHPISVDDRW
jgi:2-oxoglutarate ferredoxin oxidoreductase subunit beta